MPYLEHPYAELRSPSQLKAWFKSSLPKTSSTHTTSEAGGPALRWSASSSSESKHTSGRPRGSGMGMLVLPKYSPETVTDLDFYLRNKAGWAAGSLGAQPLVACAPVGMQTSAEEPDVALGCYMTYDATSWLLYKLWDLSSSEPFLTSPLKRCSQNPSSLGLHISN